MPVGREKTAKDYAKYCVDYKEDSKETPLQL